MLAADRVASYLVGRRLVTAEAVVDGGFVCRELARRHRSFSASCRDGPGYLLKQASLPERAAALEHEATVYAALWRGGRGTAAAAAVPRCFGYDRDEGVLVLELVAGGRTLREYHARGRFSKLLARRLGRALAAVHGFAAAGEGRGERVPAAGEPWVLSAHEPDLSFVREFSEATAQVVRMLQGAAELCGLLHELRGEWRAAALVHSDVRWDNCVVSPPPGGRRTTRLTLVDWELAGWGDPCWDVGCAFAEFLAFWLLSIPVVDPLPPDGWVELARYPIERMQPAIRSLWRAYAGARELPAEARGAWLRRAACYAAARLIQAAIEQAQHSPRPTTFAVLALQLALNLLRQPERGAAQLLGLPPAGGGD